MSTDTTTPDPLAASRPIIAVVVSLWPGTKTREPLATVAAQTNGEAVIVGRWRARHGCWTESEIADMMAIVYERVLTSVVITSGLQLALDREE
jgi:hypothetical protein